MISGFLISYPEPSSVTFQNRVSSLPFERVINTNYEVFGRRRSATSCAMDAECARAENALAAGIQW